MTLLEVTIAMAVFAIGLMGVIGVTMFSNTTASAGIYRNSAFQSMQGLLEQVRGKGVGILLQYADAPPGTAHIPLVYFDPLKNNGAGMMKGGPLGFPRRDQDNVALNPLLVNGLPVGAPLDRVFVNDPAFKAIPGAFVNAAMSCDAAGNETIRTAAPLNLQVRILLRRVNETRGSEGVSIDLLYRFSVPAAGGSREESGVLRSFVANTQVF